MCRNYLLLVLACVASLFAAENVKTVNGVARANVKTIDGVPIANIKTLNGVDNTGGGGTLVTDDFAGSGALSANWTIQAGSNMARVSDEVVTTVATTDQLAFWNADTFANDQYAQVEYVDSTGDQGSDSGVLLRSSGSGGTLNAYFVRPNGIHKFVNGSYSSVEAAAQAFNAGDILRGEIQGTTIRGYRNGVQFVTDTDASHASGAPGILHYKSSTGNVKMDDFEAGDL